MPRQERPLEAGDDALLRLAADLRKLRDEAGTPSYRELARRAHYSAGTLSEAAGGRKLPSLAVTLAYVKACDGDAAEWTARWHTVAEELAPVQDQPDDQAPYLGLSGFEAEDGDRFFGRERLVERVREGLGEHRFLAVLGASGSGKSSLLRAGLLPALADHPALVLTPGPHPLRECAVTLAARLDLTPAGLLREFAEDPRNLGLAARQLVAKLGSPTDVILVVDQFEEVFTLCRDQEERAGFIDALVCAATDAGSRAKVVIGVRTDFYSHCAQHPALAEVLQEAQVLVGPMTTEELHRAITQPALDRGYRVETALVSRLIADATGQPGVLPLISHALLETWRRRRGNTLTLAGYESTGGIERAVAQTSEAVYAALSESRRALARQIFLRLTALGEGTEDTKRRVTRDELGVPEAGAVLEELAAARLVTLHDDTAEIAHEALIRSWPRLREWLAEDREGLRVHRQVTQAAEAWELEGGDAAALHRGTRLAVAREWAAGHDALLSPRERAFLAASAAAEAGDQAAARRRARWLRSLTVLLAALLILMTMTSIHAYRAEERVTQQRDLALSQKVAADAGKLREVNPALSAQLSLAAYRLAPTEDARNGLLEVFTKPYATITGHATRVNTAAVSPDGRLLLSASRDKTAQLWDIRDPHRPRRLGTLAGHAENVNGAAFSSDGRMAATASWDHTARLWDVTDPDRPRELAVLPHGDHVNAVAFSPDGRLLATASTDHGVRVWDVAERRLKTSLTGHTDAVVSVAFSPDGRTLASGGFDGTAVLWDPGGDGSPRRLTGHRGPVAWVAFRPDGRLLATASNDGTTRLWEPDGRLTATIRKHRDVVRSAAFSPDGRTLATASLDDTVRLTDVTDPRRPRPMQELTGHTGNAVSAVFSPDGRTLVSTGDDYTIRLWDLPGSALTRQASVYWLAFSPDGRTLATVGEDRALRLWDLAHPGRPGTTLTGHTAAVWGVAFSPDGRTIATSSHDHTVRLWDRTGVLATITGHTGNVNAAAFSPDGRTLATASVDDTVRMIDIRDRRNPRDLGRFVADTEGVNTVAFSPDGRTLATAGWDHHVRLWSLADPANPALITTLIGHRDGVNALALSPSGTLMATASFDDTARLWDVTDPARARPLATLAGHSGSVNMVAFSPDGRTLATAGNDRTARLWDVSDPRHPREAATLEAHAERVTSVAFSSDGHTLATGGYDRTALLWDTDPERLADRICRLAYPRITPAEWHRHFPGVAYLPPCP
ncbi:hypothetical protein [Nonomuraea typhae]|uniref:HTH cro/C1-type domain-containing protein n=1 Tax=Nonomuraea typhae TaxID=2603600 RepID=A0ABW7YUC1_9ACTN